MKIYIAFNPDTWTYDVLQKRPFQKLRSFNTELEAQIYC